MYRLAIAVVGGFFPEVMRVTDSGRYYRHQALRHTPARQTDRTAQLKTTMAQKSLESKIFQCLGLSLVQLKQLSLGEMLNLLETQHWLAAYCALYISQKKLSHLHYSSVKKYLVRPKKVRDMRCDRRESIAIVSNRYGTTGMDPMGILKSLDFARANHPLAKLDNFKDAQIKIDRLSKQFGYPDLSHDQLLELSSFDCSTKDENS